MVLRLFQHFPLSWLGTSARPNRTWNLEISPHSQCTSSSAHSVRAGAAGALGQVLHGPLGRLSSVREAAAVFHTFHVDPTGCLQQDDRPCPQWHFHLLKRSFLRRAVTHGESLCACDRYSTRTSKPLFWSSRNSWAHLQFCRNKKLALNPT